MKKFFKALERHFIRLGQERARQQLLHLDDRLLADVGFSRELLLAGNQAWPWRVSDADGQPQAERGLSEVKIQLAITELQSFSEHELNDLGLGRGDIEHAVRYGRPQDRSAHNQAA